MIVIDRRSVEADDVTVITGTSLHAAMAKLTVGPGLSRDDVDALAPGGASHVQRQGRARMIAVPLLLVAASSIYRDIMLRPNDELTLVAMLRAAFKAVLDTTPENPARPN